MPPAAAARHRAVAGPVDAGPARLSAVSRFALRFIETYQAQVSHRLGTSCRFEPTCSEYGRQAYLNHGFFTATRMTVGRLRRCRGGAGPAIVDPP
jgi:uncharacterized protein